MSSENYSFDKLSRKELNEGSILGLKNAREKLEVSTICRDADFHATGSSLLIMASEELIKALLIRIYAETGKRPIKGFDKLFYKHQEKHSQIISTVLILFAERMENRSKEENVAILIFLALAAAILAYSQSLMEKGDRNILNLEENRQAGLYLDFHKVKKSWLSPDKEIDKESFIEYHEQISTFFDEIEKKYFSVNSSKALFQLYDSIQEIERNKI